MSLTLRYSALLFDGNNWLSGWTYRKNRPLGRASGAVTNYQIKLLIGESSGSGTCDFHCEGHCLSNFNDLRFTTSDGETLLDYWIESISGVTPNQVATVWVEFASIGTLDDNYYCYYGNAGATAYSNGANTFPFFDDFPGSSIDTSKWYRWLTGGSTSVSGSILTIVGGASNYEAQGAKTQFGTGYAYRGRAKFNVESNGVGDSALFGTDDRSANGSYIGAGVDCSYFLSSDYKKFYRAKEGSAVEGNRADSLTAYSVVEIQRPSASALKFLIADVVKSDLTTTIPANNMGVSFFAKGNTVYIDWVLVRQFLETEPAWSGSWSAEETVPSVPGTGLSILIVMEHNRRFH